MVPGTSASPVHAGSGDHEAIDGGAMSNIAVHTLVPRPQREMLFVAVPPVGYGAAFWNPVSERLDERAELRAVRLPGRETRYTEPALRRLDRAAAEVAAVVWGEAGNLPVVLVGACSGALVAFEAARLVRADSDAGCLVVLGQPHPAAAARTSLHTLPAPELMRALIEAGMLSPQVTWDAQTFAFFEPAIRADLEMVETYEYRAAEPLRCPIVTWQDGASSGETQWSVETSSQTVHALRPAGRGPLVSDFDGIAEILAKTGGLVARSAAQPGPGGTGGSSEVREPCREG